MKKNKLFVALVLSTVISQAQVCFNPGTGINGAWSATSNTVLPAGIYNFTSFNIDAGVIVTVTGNVPLEVHSLGAVTINGILSVNGGDGSNGITYSAGGNGGAGVAGGQDGGSGSFSSSSGPITANQGGGPGGLSNQGDMWSGGGGAGFVTLGASSGNSGGGFGGPQYGTSAVTALDAGSGGGGGSGGYDCGAGGGGGGGGVIVFNSGISITIGASGLITSNGGDGGTDDDGNCGGGGAGSGGTIWLGANTITNNGVITALGGLGGGSAVAGTPYFGEGGNGSDGRIRLDVNTQSGSGSIQPSPVIYSVSAIPLNVAVTATNTCTDATTGMAVASASNGAGGYTYLWAPSNATTSSISNLSLGTYTVVIADAALCAISNTFNILANPNPTTSIAVSSTSLCTGQSATLVASGAQTYSWSTQDASASIVVSPTLTSSYTVTGTDVNGCSGSTVQSIAVSALPNVSLTAAHATVCTIATGGSTVALTGSPSGGVYSGANVTGNAFNPAATGTFTTVYSFTNSTTGCSKTASTTVIVSQCTTTFVGIADLQQNSVRISIYPNPNNGTFMINATDNSELTIINSLGQVVSEMKLESGEQSVDISAQPKGVYFISLKSNGRNYFEKVIKE